MVELGNAGLGWPARASSSSPAMVGGGGRGRRAGSRDGGVSGPIYRPEGSWAKLLVLGGGRSGLGWLDGEVTEGAAADCMAGRRGSLGRRWGRVPARGGAKGRPGGLGGLPRVRMAKDAPWMRSTGGVRASGGEAEWGEGNRDSFANFKSSGTSR